MKILQELESLIPPLSNEEFKQLERNILEEGNMDAISIDTLIFNSNLGRQSKLGL
jgi:hypothetical protein